MPHDDNFGTINLINGLFNAPNHIVRANIARSSNYIEIANALVKNELR